MPGWQHTAIQGHSPYPTSLPGSAITLVVPENTNLPGALCVAVAPEVFFAEGDAAEFAEPVAKRICVACPVRMTCLNLAIQRDERFGVFGGLTTAERDALTGRPGGCGSTSGYKRHRNAGDTPCRACHDAHRAAGAAWRARKADTESDRMGEAA